jgi:hypothetical protein
MEALLFTSIEIVALSGGTTLSSLWNKLNAKGYQLDDSYKKFIWEKLKLRHELIFTPKTSSYSDDVTLNATQETRDLALGIVQVTPIHFIPLSGIRRKLNLVTSSTKYWKI